MDVNAIDLMLATNHPPCSRAGWIFEFKYGYRVLASKDQLVTRNKKDATAWYPEIVQALDKVRGSFIIDGEVCLLDDKGIPNFEEMSRVAPSASATRRSCGVASEPPVHPRFEYDRASVIAGPWMTVA